MPPLKMHSLLGADMGMKGWEDEYRILNNEYRITDSSLSPANSDHSKIMPSRFSSRFSALSPIAMRLEMKEAINRCSLINDSYNSDINSLGIALDFLNPAKSA